MSKIIIKNIDIAKTKNDTVVCAIFENTKTLGKSLEIADKVFQNKVTELFKNKVITGKKSEITILHGVGECPIKQLIIVGLGKKEVFSFEVLRRVAGSVSRRLMKEKVKEAVWLIDQETTTKLDVVLLSQALVEGLLLGSYQFTEFKTKNKHKDVLPKVILSFNQTKIINAKVKQAVHLAIVYAEANNLARDLANRPANVVTPYTFVQFAKELFKDNKEIKLNVLDAKKAKELGMNAFLGVAQGSVNDPYILTLEYQNNKKSKQGPIAIIGKGVTFDSGGISIKPADHMEDMKGDMSGAANVLATMMAISKLKPAKHILAIIPLVENMPSGTAQRPGDIVYAMNGKSIEVINTDAEGRLILADAICYAVAQKASQIIDMATLTGACNIALGDVASAIIGNKQSVINQLIEISKFTGELLWQLPLYERYLDYLSSDYADIKNCATNRKAGTATAAKFLEQFVAGTPWVHIDIASTNQYTKTFGYTVKGMSGTGVRNLISYLN